MSSERNADSRSKAQKVVQKSEKEGRNEVAIDYDERNPFSVCCSTLKPVYKGSPSVKCSFCASTYVPDARGRLCETCRLANVGVETVGLVTSSSRTK
jgi:coatomer protein complex subunit alpha (xenin)